MTDSQRDGDEISQRRPQHERVGAPSVAGQSIPKAVLKPRRRVSAAWLVPALALLFAGWLAYQAWSLRGVTVTVQLPEGFGLEPGDEVRYRGIKVGEVRRVELAEGLDGIRITAALHTEADRLACSGSRYWVVRPQLGLAGVAGLETLIGPRYLAVLPGDGPRRRHFIGLADPPVVHTVQPGDLEIILQASQQGSLRRGAPVTYRQVQVGTVLSVGLASDGGAIEARVHIGSAYAQLIRQHTRFWGTGGVEAKLGLGGLSLQVRSLETLLRGSVALATPPEAGDVVRTGHRFPFEADPPEDWLDWQPLTVIGSSMLPPGAPLPNPLRATIGWTQGWWIGRERSRQGWVLQITQGLIGPADLLRPNEDADRETIVLEVAGTELPLDAEPIWEYGGLAVIGAQVAAASWPSDRLRSAREPEDCLAVGDPTATPLPLAAARLTQQQDLWAVDPAVTVDDSWHGACVVARADGYLVGLLLVEKGTVKVALLPHPDSFEAR